MVRVDRVVWVVKFLPFSSSRVRHGKGHVSERCPQSLKKPSSSQLMRSNLLTGRCIPEKAKQRCVVLWPDLDEFALEWFKCVAELLRLEFAVL